MRSSIGAHFLPIGLLLAGTASAESVPLTVRVNNGDPVQSVDFAGRSGLVELQKSPDGHRFTGSIRVDSGDSVSQQLVINYPDFGYPMLLRVFRHLPQVEFPVGARLPSACTLAKIVSVEAQTTDLASAISKSIQAARLASIEGNDRCDAGLRARAIAAKFRNARRMAQLSQGLFVIPDQLIAEYRSLPTASTAAAEINRYASEAIELQAVQLVAARTEAQRDGKFAEAAAIQGIIRDQAAQSEVAFARVGLTKSRIEADSAFLDTMARDQAQAER